MLRQVLKLKMNVRIDTPASRTQVRNALINSGIQGKAENKITALVASDVQTTLDATRPFDWRLGVGEKRRGNELDVQTNLWIIVDSTRPINVLYAALDPYYDALKTELMALIMGATTLVGTHPFHVHRSDMTDGDETP